MTTPCLKVPGFVVTGMNDLGIFDVPNGDICGQIKLASAWSAHGSKSAGPAQEASAAGQQVSSNNKSAAVAAFTKEFTGPQAPVANLLDASTGAKGIAIGILAGAGILASLMVFDVARVTMMLVAIAEAVATAIASLFAGAGVAAAEILAIKEVTSAALNTAINTALDAVMGH